MATHIVTVEAIYEDGVLRPVPPLPLAPRQRVIITVQMPIEAAGFTDPPAAELPVMEAPFEPVPETWPVSERLGHAQCTDSLRVITPKHKGLHVVPGQFSLQ